MEELKGLLRDMVFKLSFKEKSILPVVEGAKLDAALSELLIEALEAVVGATALVALNFKNGGGAGGAAVETDEVGWGISPKPKAVKCILVLPSSSEPSFSSIAWCRTAAEAVLNPTVFEITVAVPLTSISVDAVSLVDDGPFKLLLHAGSGRSTGIGVKSYSAKFRGNEVSRAASPSLRPVLPVRSLDSS